MGSRDFLQWVERRGNDMRRLLSLAPLDVLNPYHLANKMQAHILSPHDVGGITDELLHQLLIEDPGGWSAGTVRLPNREILIVLNPTHPDTRKRATLMEELSHMQLNHRPTHIILIKGILAFRCYRKTEETQAYWVGAAALVTQIILRHAQRNGIPREAVATRLGVSAPLVEFREKVTGIRLH